LTIKHHVAALVVGAVSVAAIFLGVGIIVADNTAAVPSDKVRICHASSSQTNPYQSISIDTNSIDNPNEGGEPTATVGQARKSNDYLNGHGDHTGPVFTPGADSWGDIIPPFTSPQGNSFAGYNWVEGQEIWTLDCSLPTPTESPSPTETESPSPTETESPSPTATESPSPTPLESPSPSPTSGGGSGVVDEVQPPAVEVFSPEGAETIDAPPPVAVVIEDPGFATEMPAPVNVAPQKQTMEGGDVTSVPAGEGELTLSLAGIGLLGGGIAGVSGTSVWLADRRRIRKSE
jgi:hypothetical protein